MDMQKSGKTNWVLNGPSLEETTGAISRIIGGGLLAYFLPTSFPSPYSYRTPPPTPLVPPLQAEVALPRPFALLINRHDDFPFVYPFTQLFTSRWQLVCWSLPPLFQPPSLDSVILRFRLPSRIANLASRSRIKTIKASHFFSS